MDAKNDGGPASPTPDGYVHPGMSLRDYFAAAALQGILARSPETNQMTAEDAYGYADAMLKAREAK